MFKKIKFQIASGNCVDTMEGEDVSVDEVIRIIKDPNMINITITKMTAGEYLRRNNNSR